MRSGVSDRHLKEVKSRYRKEEPPMKMYYIVNARMPSEKAYGIQIAKTCEALIEQGVELELCIPRTRYSHIPLRDFYHLRVDVPTRVLTSPGWYDRGRLGYIVSSLIFMASACWHLLSRDRSALLYTIDMDAYSFAPLGLLDVPIAVEMHSPKPSNILTRFFFKRADYIVTTNPLTREKLSDTFGLAPERFIVEPNGVDPRAFGTTPKEEARKKLGLPQESTIALYVGRFYDWKGMQVLQKAAKELEERGFLLYLVGGDQKEFEERTGGPSVPLRFGGAARHTDIPLWCAAADVLLVLGTRANEFSYRYTAPMKLFEYLASERPVVAADTPALRSLVSEQEVQFYIPDDPHSLTQAIYTAHANSQLRLGAGRARAAEHTWQKRIERILAFVRPVSVRGIQKALTFRASSIGDCLMGKYLLENIHAHYPHARLGIVVAGRAAMIRDLFAAYPWLEIIEANRWRLKSLFSLWKTFRGSDVVVTQYSGKKGGRFGLASKLFARLLAKKGGLVGFADASRANGFLYDRLLPVRSDKAIAEHEREALAATGVPLILPFPKLEFVRDNGVLAKFHLEAEQYVVVHLFAGGRKRALGPEKGRELLAALRRTLPAPITIVVSGASAERELAQELARDLGVQVIAGEATLQEMMALIRESRAVVSVDTGMAHIAAQLGKPLVVLRTCLGRNWWFPAQYGADAPVTVFSREERCAAGHLPEDFPPCINDISAEDVAARAATVIR